jgi:tetratricopeptide (TPR) repeat protein
MTQGATKIDPQIAETIERAMELNRQNQAELAIEIMSALVTEFPASAKAHGVLSLLYWSNGQFDAAIKYSQIAVQLSPTSALASMVLYSSLGKTGLLVEALEEMKRYLSMKPTGKYAEILRGLKREIEEDLERNPDADSDC